MPEPQTLPEQLIQQERLWTELSRQATELQQGTGTVLVFLRGKLQGIAFNPEAPECFREDALRRIAQVDDAIDTCMKAYLLIQAQLAHLYPMPDRPASPEVASDTESPAPAFSKQFIN
jgi:hypothetical protein